MYKFHSVKVRLFYDTVYGNLRRDKPEIPTESVRGIVSNMTIGFVYGLYDTGMMDSKTCRALVDLAGKVLPKEKLDLEMAPSKEASDATDQHPNEPND
jgi:hypothetical protein